MHIKHFILMVGSTVPGLCSFAQKTFTVNNASKTYTAKIAVAKCDEGTCSGKGTVKLYTRSNAKLLQELKSPDLYFNLDSSNNPSAVIELYDERSPLVFGDFNFDGSEDLALKNGNNSGYGGPSYDVYVFNSTKKKFVLSKELTVLASTNLGMFETDAKTKQIRTSAKSGCCWHRSTEYSVVPQKGLVKVHIITEDASKGDDNVYVKEEKLVNGKWARTTKKYTTKEYYKD